MKQNFTFFFLLFLTIVFGQKTVNDSLISKFEKKIVYLNQEILKLKDLKKTNEDFYFRLNSNEITIELFNNNGVFNLESHQYYFQGKNGKNIDTIVNHIKYNNEIAIWLYDNINRENIGSKTPEKNKFSGKSGIFMPDDYYLEFSNKNNYSIKSFPHSNLDTISENYTLRNLINDLYEKIEVENIKKAFIDRLPSGYNYKKLFSYSFYKMANSSLQFGYYSNIRLPLGFSFYYNLRKVKKKNLNIGSGIILQNNFKDNIHFEGELTKRGIFEDRKNYTDSFRITYEFSKLNYIKTVSNFENYKIIYSGTIDKYFSFDLGYNQLKTEKKSNGFSIGLSKNYESIHLEPFYKLDCFQNKMTNYKIGFYKSFPIRTDKKSFRIYTSLFYEKTFDFRSLNFSLYVPIKYWTIN